VRRAALKVGDRTRLYTDAVRLLARLRARTEKAADPKCLAFTRAFDETLYDWELHHFREWGMEIWSGKKPTDAQRQELDAIFKRIARELAAAPRNFTHRDYQSRNIMVVRGDDPLKIKQRCGHTTFSTTELYIREAEAIREGFGIVVPAGTRLDIFNTGESVMKLYTVYSPPNHRDGVVHQTRAEADADAERFDGKTTET
jgi:hypothetical protein